MANIAQTLIGTSDPVSLCTGYPLFPPIPDTGAGLTSGASTQQLCNTEVNLLVFSFTATASIGFFIGLCGPGYGFLLNAAGTADGNQINLQLAGDKIQGGMFCGFNIQAALGINASALQIEWQWDGWNSGFRSEWVALLNVNIDLTVDMIALFISLIEYMFSESTSSIQKLDRNIFPTLEGSYGFFDQGQTQIATDGQMSFDPELALPINIVSFIAEGIPAFKAFIDGMKKINADIAFGPQIGIAIPTTVKVTGAVVSDATNTTVYDANPTIVNGRFSATSGTPGNIAAPTTLALQMTHQPAFQILLGVFFQVSVLKLFSFGATSQWDLLQILGKADPTVGPFNNLASNTIGSTSIGNAGASAREVLDSDLIDIILAPGMVHA